VLKERGGQFSESRPLFALLVEVFGMEPTAKRLPEGGPFCVNHRIPGSVTVSPFYNDGLSEDSLIGESQSLRRPARGKVEGIALPFVPTISQIKDSLHHQKHSFRRGGSSLKKWRVAEVTDLNAAVSGVNAEVARYTDSPTCPIVQNRMKQRVVAVADTLYPRAIAIQGIKGAIGQVCPHSPLGIQAIGRIERLGVKVCIERFDSTEASLHGLSWWK
jgi:hypothetical protein